MRAGRWNVMNHIATMGGPYLVVVGAGNSFTMSHKLRRERVIMTIYEFQILLVTSVPGEGGVMPLYSIWAGSTLLCVPPPLHGFLW
jgi:energy-converting hydrogenase Eha subunit H